MRQYIGDRAFYGRVLKVMIPIVIQQGITNFVGLLDNIMVGQVGTEQMSGVAITNQLLFIFQLCIFGSLSGAGIFCAQYFGKGDQEKVKSVFRYKVLTTGAITLLAMAIFCNLFRLSQLLQGSYTCYLFEKGLDKILKKVGEESAETIIAAKNDVQSDTPSSCMVTP